MSKFKHWFWTKILWLAYRNLVEKGICPVGVPGIRDIEFPCNAFDPRPAKFDPNPTCETDGHNLCEKCCHKALKPEYEDGYDILSHCINILRKDVTL